MPTRTSRTSSKSITPRSRLDLLVGGEHPGHRGEVEPRRLTAGRPRCRGIGLGRQHAHLGPLDLGREVADTGAVEPHPQPSRGLCDGTGLVRHDLGSRTADRLRPEVVQLPQRRGVERPGLHAPHTEVTQPGAHLARCPGREGDRERALRLLRTGQHGIRDPVGDGAGLARAGSCEHDHRAGRVGRDLPLLRVETVEDRVGGGVWGQGGHRCDPRWQARPPPPPVHRRAMSADNPAPEP